MNFGLQRARTRARRAVAPGAAALVLSAALLASCATSTPATSTPAAASATATAATTSTTPAPPTPDPSYTPGATTPDEYAQQLFTLTNQHRQDEGLEPLEWSECLADTAAPRAQTASTTETLEHELLISPCQDEGVTVENLARLAATPAVTFDAWLASPGHAQNLNNPTLGEAGIACVYPSVQVADAVTCSWLAQGPAE